MNKENKTIEEIEKEFDKLGYLYQKVSGSPYSSGDGHLSNIHFERCNNKIRNFIKEKFETYFEKRLKERVPKEKSDYFTEKEIKRLNLKTKEQQWAMRAKSEGYNQCLSDILTKSK